MGKPGNCTDWIPAPDAPQSEFGPDVHQDRLYVGVHRDGYDGAMGA